MLNPDAQLVTVNSATVDALTYDSGSQAPDEKLSVTFAQISAAYPSASAGILPNHEISIPFDQHPSITVCLELMKRHLLVGKMYGVIHMGALGSSNPGCCGWCDDWIKTAATILHFNVHRSESDSKYPTGWLLPQGAPASVTNAMVASIKDNIDRVLKVLEGHSWAKGTRNCIVYPFGY